MIGANVKHIGPRTIGQIHAETRFICELLEKIPEDHRVDFTADEISVKEKISQIADMLEAKGSLTFLELFTADPDKRSIIITFLALLEMVKLALVRIVQHVQTGIIRVFYV